MCTKFLLEQLVMFFVSVQNSGEKYDKTVYRGLKQLFLRTQMNICVTKIRITYRHHFANWKATRRHWVGNII